MALASAEPVTPKEELLAFYLKDPCAFCREILPHVFTKPMPWFHRALLAILTRETSFLLKFQEERWSDGRRRWTKKHLSKIVRHFTYPINPADRESPRKPIFKVRYAEDGRTPIRVDLVISKNSNYILPRGTSKTTVVNAAVEFMILYELIEYFVYISEAQRPHAENQLATVKRELSTNDKIISLWGNVVPSRMDEEDNRVDQIEFTNGVMGAAKGRGSQIRGMNKFYTRPDLIIMDDLENEESILTEEQREKTREWVYGVVDPALVKVGKVGRLINLCTMRHPEDIGQTLAKDSAYTTVTLGAIDLDGEPLWDHWMDKQGIDAERERYARLGRLRRFGMEYLSRADMLDQAKFKAENYKRYRFLSPDQFIREFPIRCIAIDPAISDDPRACFCAIAVVGLSGKGFYHVPDLFMQIGVPPDEQVTRYFDMAIRWQCTRFLVETVSYQKALKHYLKEAMFTRQFYFEIESAEKIPGNDKSKHIRVEGILQPRIAAQVMTFNERWPDLEAQLMDWDAGGKKDGPDVISMALVGADPFAGLALGRELKEGEIPEILKDKTMPDLDIDLEDLGVP